MKHGGATFDISGRVACVTGAGSGLGFRIAQVLVAAGASVVGILKPSDDPEDLTKLLEGSGTPLVADIARRDGITALADRIATPLGAPDIFVHVPDQVDGRVADDVQPEEWDATTLANLTVPFFLAKALVPAMKAGRWGRIVMVSPSQGTRAVSGRVADGITTAAVGQLTRSMAEAWSKDGINANSICTGAPLTDPEEAARTDLGPPCTRRAGKLSDIDGPVLFLCSDASAFVTGQVLFVDGGSSAV